MSRIRYFGVPLDLLDHQSLLDRIDASIRSKERLRIEGLNVAKLVESRSDSALLRALEDAELVHADGAGVALGLRMSGIRTERYAGIDLMFDMWALAEERGYSVYLLGAREDVLAQAVANLRAQYPRLRLAGVRNGYFGDANEPAIVDEIRKSAPDMLFIGISSPKKELFVQRHWANLGATVALGVGGSFDVVAGKVQRAPEWIQRAHLEWAYRVWQEPRRLWRRYAVTNVVFGGLLARAAVRRVVLGQPAR